MSELNLMSFQPSELTNVEVEAIEQAYAPLAADVRRLRDLTIRSAVDAEQVAQARALIQQASQILAADAPEGPAGIHFNEYGRSWNWGNAVVGLRNAVAPPVQLSFDDDGVVRAALTLGEAYEGPPGCVHGGISALMLDHLMGETASAVHSRVTVTGTLTLRYVHPLPLGPIRLAGWISAEEGRKVTVTATISPDVDGAPASVEASGLFIIPRWAVDAPQMEGIGSLD